MAAALEQERPGTLRPAHVAASASSVSWPPARQCSCSSGRRRGLIALLAFAYAVAILMVLRLTRQFKAAEAGRWSMWLMLGVAAELTRGRTVLEFFTPACLALALLPVWLVRPLGPGPH